MPTADFPGIGCQQPDVVGRDGVGDVAGQGGDLLDFDAGTQFHLVPGDRRAAGEAGDGGVHVELFENTGDPLDHVVVRGGADLGRRAELQQFRRRQLVRISPTVSAHLVQPQLGRLGDLAVGVRVGNRRTHHPRTTGPRWGRRRAGAWTAGPSAHPDRPVPPRPRRHWRSHPAGGAPGVAVWWWRGPRSGRGRPRPRCDNRQDPVPRRPNGCPAAGSRHRGSGWAPRPAEHRRSAAPRSHPAGPAAGSPERR